MTNSTAGFIGFVIGGVISGVTTYILARRAFEKKFEAELEKINADMRTLFDACDIPTKEKSEESVEEEKSSEKVNLINKANIYQKPNTRATNYKTDCSTSIFQGEEIEKKVPKKDDIKFLDEESIDITYPRRDFSFYDGDHVMFDEDESEVCHDDTFYDISGVHIHEIEEKLESENLREVFFRNEDKYVDIFVERIEGAYDSYD